MTFGNHVLNVRVCPIVSNFNIYTIPFFLKLLFLSAFARLIGEWYKVFNLRIFIKSHCK
jgi:hypothetical protein